MYISRVPIFPIHPPQKSIRKSGIQFKITSLDSYHNYSILAWYIREQMHVDVK